VKQEPARLRLFGQRGSGAAFCATLLKLGATRDWRKVMREATGEDNRPARHAGFYQPLLADLAK